MPFFPYNTISEFFEAEGDFPENGVEEPRDLVEFGETDEGVKWFLNEDLTPYPYPAHLQEEAFPNDLHTVFDSEAAARVAADQVTKGWVEFDLDSEEYDEVDLNEFQRLDEKMYGPNPR